MPEAAQNYSITELDMCGLAINIASFVHLLKKVDFDMIVDHLAITFIMKIKAEPATTRIRRLLELLSSYSFNLYYIKGKDMVLSDFLSRQKTDDSSPNKIIPISFSLRRVLCKNYCKLDNTTETAEIETDKYLVQTRSQKSKWYKSARCSWCRQRFSSTCQARTSKINSNTTHMSNTAYTSNTVYRQRTAYKHYTNHAQA